MLGLQKKIQQQKSEKENNNQQEENKQEGKQKNVFSLKSKKGGSKKTKVNASEIRVQKDISELDMEAMPGVSIDFHDPNNLMTFKATVKPYDGLYKGAEFQFTINVPNTYPYEPPKVVCNTLVYHPNIDWEGAVCLNILRADWKPVLTLGSVLIGLMTLFLEPNPDDPLNPDAANLMISNRSSFENYVKQSLKGGVLFGKKFPKLL